MEPLGSNWSTALSRHKLKEERDSMTRALGPVQRLRGGRRLGAALTTEQGRSSLGSGLGSLVAATRRDHPDSRRRQRSGEETGDRRGDD